MKSGSLWEKVLAIFAGAFSLFVATSCDVGLGESVDTSAPTLEIAYPPIAATIRDSFVLYGKWTDDKGVSKVSVSVIDTATKATKTTKTATVNANGTWQVSLNEFNFETGKYELLDGTYQVSVTAYDEANHSSGETSRTFDIDNTPPVFIISKPGVKNDGKKDASKYGSLFTIDGTIADDHTIALMDVKIYDADSNELLSSETYDGEALEAFRTEEIPTAGGTSVTIAQYGNGTRYSQLHPEDSGTKTYYAEITLTDSAKIYQNPTGSERSALETKNDSLGNATSKLYLYDDVYTALMSSKKGLGLSAADLKNVLNGTVSNEEALEILAAKTTDTSADTDSKLLFSLNPESNPTYTVSGYTFGFGENAVVQSASSGNTVNVTVNSGLDGVKVDPSTVKVWIKKYDSKPTDEAVIKEDIQKLASKVSELEANAKNDDEKTISDENKALVAEELGWSCFFDYYEYNGESVDVEAIAVTLPSDIKINKYYILAVTGYDVDDVPFSHNTVYGFAGNETGIAPTIEFNSPENGTFVSANTVVFEGTAKVNSDSMTVAKLTATITAASGSNSNLASQEITVAYINNAWKCEPENMSEAFTYKPETGVWNFTPSKIPDFISNTKDATKYTLSVYGQSSSGHDVTMSTMVQLDTTDPEVKITTITPTISGSDVSDVVKKSDGYAADNVYINGTIRIMGSIVEQNLKAVTYDILATSDLNTDIAEKDADGKYKNSILSHLEAATRGRDVYYDGHLETSNSIDIKFMTANVTQGMLAAHVIEKDQPIKIRVILTAEDEVGNKGEYSSNTYNNGKDFLIYQETDRPQITLGNAFEEVDAESKINVDKNLFLTTSNKLSVTFSDDDGVNSYKITVKDSAGNEIDDYSQTVTPNKAFTSGSKTLTLPSKVGVYKVQVEATDENYIKTDLNASGAYGIATSKEFFVAIDNGAPTVTADSVAAYLSPSDKISGSISPSAKGFENGTEISATFLDSELNALSPQPATLTATKSGTSWLFPLSSMPKDKSGSYTLRITATDKYGQTGSTTVKFGMDPIAPTIDGTNFKNQTVKLDESNFVTLTANASDDAAGSGIASFGYCLSESNTVPTSYDSAEWKSLNQTNDGWNVTFDISQTKNDDGTLYAFLAAKDNAGNTTIFNKFAKFTIDKAVPTSTVKITTDGKVLNQSKTELSGSEAEFGKIYYSSKTFTLGGEIIETNLDVSEENKPKLTVKKDGGSETALSFTTGGTSAGAWTYKMPADSADGSYEYTLTVKDNVGSEFSKSVTVNLDTKAPTVDFTSPADGESFESAPSAKIAYSDDGVGIDTSKITYTITDASGNAIASSAYSVLNGGATGAVTFNSAFDTEGSFKISASVEDYFGNKTTTEPRSFYFDKAKPSVSESKVGSSGITTNSGFTLGGTVSDTNGLKSLVISDGNDKTWSVSVSGKESSWTKDFVVGESNKAKENYLADGSYSFAIVATDVAGKTTQISRSIKIDTVAPTFGNDSPSDSNTTNVIPHVATSSVDVGGTAWYKTNDLKIAGTASDGDGTGISEVYFETSDDGNSWGGKTDLAGTKSWSGTVSGVESGKTRIRVTVVDNAGNSQTSTVLGPFSIDTKEPELTEGSVKIGSSSENASESTSYLSNGNSDIFVSFEVTDETGGSGIESVYVLPYEKISAATKVEANKATLEGGKASFTIGKDKISKSGTVYARIFDNAGNYTDSNVFSITFDNTAPIVTLNNPSDASTDEGIQINGKIKLSGTANDENMLAEICRIEYAETDSATDSDWTDAASIMDAISGTYNFSAENFDTIKLSADVDKTYYLRAIAKDTAGNEGKSDSVKVVVSQNSDRPTVKVTNITKSGSEYFLKYGTNAQIAGSISDDDSTSSAVVTVFKASGKEIVLGSDGKIDESKIEGETSFSETSGEWTFTPENKDDGEKEVYFYIEDSDGGIFYTKNDSSLKQPYFQYKTDAATDSESKLTYKSDSKSPRVSGTTVSDFGEAEDGTTVSTTDITLSSAYVAGGSKKGEISFTITASDASGIAGLTADLYYEDAEGNTHYIANKATEWDEKEGKKYIAGVELVENDSVTYTKDSTSWAQTENGVDTSWTWTTDEINISSVPTGTVTLNITPYDKAGLTGNQSFTFNIDNSAPAIVIRTPESGKEVTGSVEISGTTSDTGSAGIANIHWIVPTKNEVDAAKNKAEASERLRYLKGLNWNGGAESLAADTGLSAWQFNFDGSFDKTTSDPSKYSYKAGNPLFTEFDTEDFAQNPDYASNSIYELPVWFKVTDALGNIHVKTDYVIKHNPDWDKPKLEFTYPTNENYKSETEPFAVLGGTIRATGSAEIPSGTTTVKAVYYQIADSNGKFTTADKEKASKAIAEKGYGYTIVSAYDVINEISGTSYTSSTTFSADELKKFGFASNDALAAWWGIKATGTASWNIKLNSNGELNPESGKTTDITLRACGVNAEGKFGAWTTGDNVIAIHVDNTAPVISSAVNQYAKGEKAISGVPTGSYTSSQTYEDDMYLRGNWTLVATLLDETSVTGYSVLKNGTALTKGTDYFVEENVEDTSINKNGVRLYIPIPKDDDSVEITVNANDGEHTSTQVFKFKIDEKAPTLERDTEASYDITSETPEEIKDSNYIFTLGGKSTDTGSGVERVVVYFSRNIDGTGVTKYASDDTSKTNPLNAVIFDPMLSTGSKVPMTGLTVRKFTQGAAEYELYTNKYSGTATTDEFTTTGTYDAHVRAGGLVEIDGVLRKITKVDGKKVEFTPSLTQEKTTSFDAYFPIAQVIDNSAKEETKNNKDNPFVFAKGDDGDLMPESFSKTGSVWTWDATIHSTNIPDGPVNIVILAFDKAGNVTGKTIPTKITNNAPRIAKVYFGTDLSGDGKFVNTASLQEIVEYNILAAEGKEQSEYELDFTAKDEKNRAKYANGIFTIKNGLAVIPEFTGGNGNIGMVLNDSAENANRTTGTSAAGTLIASSAAGVKTTTTDEDTGIVDVSVSFTGDSVNGTFKGSDPSYGMQAFVVAKDKLGSDATSKGMSFTFWDSTEETVQGTSSQSSVLFVKNFKLAQTDSTAPTVVVNPFYWNSITDNSIYDSTAASKFTDLKGHIELEKDLEITKADGTTVDTALKTQLGEDPKVSGKITVSGTAYDNTRLASLTVKFGSYKTAVAATYDATTSSWNVPATTLADDGYIFTVSDVQKDSKGNTKYYGNWEEDVYFGQKGHKVYWTLSLDTEKLLGTTAVAKDVSLSVTAKDAAGKTTATTVTAATTDAEGKRLVTDGTTNVPTYQMDVVPYVVKVTTALSKKKKSNPSVANRTALGHYPVQTVVTNMSSAMNNYSSETVTLEGFNLNHATLSVTGGTSVSSTASSASEMSKIMFNVASLASGKMTATVNSIPVINNLNNNDASGDAESAGTNNINWYNRNGNGDNNNTLTDDVIFDVWEFNDKAAVPFSGTVGGTKMKINQVSGQPNFAFTNGNLWWNMGGNVNVNGKPSGDFSSYYWSGGYDCLATVTVGFHVDEMGYTYGSGAGGDSNTSTPPAIDSYTMWVQRWGLGSQDARSTYGTGGGQVTNGAALEKVGQTEVVNGVTKYSMNKQRIQSPEFASAKNGNNTNLYHAYYDAMNDEIRFKAGTIKGTKNRSSGQFVDQYCSQYGESSQTYNIDNVQVVASKSIPGRGPGKYLGIAVAKDGTTDVVVMVWYDAYENQLLYSYKVNPIANLNSKDATAANWSAPKTIFDEGGEWCQIAVDAKNHIHIAAFAGDGDLKYAYLDSYSTAKADIKTCTVDADGTVGEHLTLDVALDSDGNSIPYIGYYSSTHKKPKYAYVVDTSAPAPAGVDEDDMFTGAWEVTVVPCYSNMVVNQEEKINVGVWKYTADNGTSKKGQIKNSVTGKSEYYSATGDNLYNGTNWSKTYGNGTANGILAYQVQDGSGSCVETAQMR
ncbi:Ig-like domain-containing protein [Treponema zioleckii]|uniref:Ig-like domain-containing protein n=1 Tax=Treponema zioleckii TaxID=331680 RepID=UPI00168A46D8|nr:Ig-like domain-containing protein [Treponema zioleckii]